MIIAGCALFFTWWKSVWSQPLLNYFHHTLHITVSRTIDSSDLFALPVLFIVYFIKPPEYDLKNFYTNILHKLVAIGCLFAFCNTTAIRHSFYSLRPNEVHFQIGFTSVYTEKQIIQKIKDAGLTWYKDSVRFYPIDDPHIYYQVKSTHDSTVWVQAANRNDSALFFRKESSPFYILSFYVIDGDTLKNIEFTISDSGKKKKPSYITIESFRIPNLEPYESRNKAYKKYKKHFQKLFSE